VARGVKDRAGYLLFHSKNHPIAIIVARDNNHELDAGMRQGHRYAEMLAIPFVYRSNGDGVNEHNRTRSGGVEPGGKVLPERLR
jgi:type I restriction enzyme, R subunit